MTGLNPAHNGAHPLVHCMEKGFARMVATESKNLVDVLRLMVKGLDLEDIAAELRLSYAAVKDRAHRARRAAQPYFNECKE